MDGAFGTRSLPLGCSQLPAGPPLAEHLKIKRAEAVPIFGKGHPETNYHSCFLTAWSKLQKNWFSSRKIQFPTEKCIFLPKNAFSCRKMHFPAEKCGFRGAHGRKSQEIAGGLRGSRIKSASQLSQERECDEAFLRLNLSDKKGFFSEKGGGQKGISPELRATWLSRGKKGAISEHFLLIFLCLEQKRSGREPALNPCTRVSLVKVLAKEAIQ